MVNLGYGDDEDEIAAAEARAIAARVALEMVAEQEENAEDPSAAVSRPTTRKRKGTKKSPLPLPPPPTGGPAPTQPVKRRGSIVLGMGATPGSGWDIAPSSNISAVGARGDSVPKDAAPDSDEKEKGFEEETEALSPRPSPKSELPSLEPVSRINNRRRSSHAPLSSMVDMLGSQKSGRRARRPSFKGVLEGEDDAGDSLFDADLLSSTKSIKNATMLDTEFF